MVKTTPSFSVQLSTHLAAFNLTLGQAARKIGGDEGYKAALKRLHRYEDNPPISLALLESDLDALGLQLTITNK